MRLGPIQLFGASEPKPLVQESPTVPPGLGRGALTDELGRSGLPVMAGRVWDEFLPALQGFRAAKVYREMWMNDAVVSAIWFAVDMLIRKVDWKVEPGGDSPQDTEAADFLTSVKGDMSTTWEDFISEVLSMVIFGFAPCELVYKFRRGQGQTPGETSKFNDGRLGWRKLPLRAQETVWQWDFDDSGGVQAMVQVAPPDYQNLTIPIGKLLLFRTLTHKGNPEGRSILRPAYRSWLFKKRIEEIEGIGIERDLAGLPVLKVPAQLLLGSASATEKALLSSLQTLVTNIRRDAQEGVILPQQYDAEGNPLYELSLLSTGSRRQFDTDKVIGRYNQQIAMTIMADFILLGHEAVGSKALGMSKIELFTAAIQAWVNSISATINRHGVTRLFALNDLKVDKLPEITPGSVDVPDLNELGAYIEALAASGMPLFPDGGLENYLRTVAGLPERPEGEPTGPPQPLAAKQPKSLSVPELAPAPAGTGK